MNLFILDNTVNKYARHFNYEQNGYCEITRKNVLSYRHALPPHSQDQTLILT